MKKNFIYSAVFILCLLISVFNVIFVIKDNFRNDISVLPEGKFLYSSMSPDGEITVSVYRADSNICSAIRAETVRIDQGGNKIKRNIFWQTESDTVIVGWMDNQTVSINEKLINVYSDDFYDSRNED